MEKLTEEQRKANKAAYQKKHYEANKESLAAQGKVYKKANKKYIAAQKKAYRETNKELILAREKAFREANREEYNISKKRYREQLPSGVYQIQSITEPDKIYVGGSTQIPVRWMDHLSRLKKGRHDNANLQDHYDEYGKNDLVFSILMLVDEADLALSEQAFLNEIKPYFNMRRAMAEVN